MMLVRYSFVKSQIVLSLVLLMVFTAGIGPVQAGSTTQELAQPLAPSTMAFDGAMVNEYMAECQSVGAGDCFNYALTLAGAGNVAATGVQSEQFSLSVNDVGSLSRAFDGTKVNEYMAECQSVMGGSVVECLDYAFGFAAPDTD